MLANRPHVVTCALLALAVTLHAQSTPPATTTAPATAPDYSSRILTPPAPLTPRINGPRLFGVRAGNPCLYTIPATGQRPLTFSADNLPAGLTLDPATGRISGILPKAGDYQVTLHAKNPLGTADKPFTLVVGETIALTPPMGWNSWNCWASAVDQEKVLRSAKAMVASGLVNHGWTYINIDDAWQGVRGGDLKSLQPDLVKFPNMKGLCDDIHALGLKAGIYSTPWVKSYAGRLGGSAENPEGAAQTFPGPVVRNKKVLPHAVGKYSFAPNDAKQFAAWGIDYLKYDWGPVEPPEAREMADALRASGRDIFYSISNNAVGNIFAEAADIAKIAGAWRTTTDINDNFTRVTDIGFGADKWAPFQSPGHYNDPDMLVVGWVGWGPKLHYTKLTADEQYTHITLWCLLSAPLLIGCDLDQLNAFTLSLLTNDEVLAVDQDPLVKPAVRAYKDGTLEVYLKDLEDGTHAVGFFNRGTTALTATVQWSQLGLTGKQQPRDLWRQQDIPNALDKIDVSLAPHGASMYKLTAAK